MSPSGLTIVGNGCSFRVCKRSETLTSFKKREDAERFIEEYERLEGIIANFLCKVPPTHAHG